MHDTQMLRLIAVPPNTRQAGNNTCLVRTFSDIVSDDHGLITMTNDVLKYSYHGINSTLNLLEKSSQHFHAHFVLYSAILVKKSFSASVGKNERLLKLFSLKLNLN